MPRPAHVDYPGARVQQVKQSSAALEECVRGFTAQDHQRRLDAVRQSPDISGKRAVDLRFPFGRPDEVNAAILAGRGDTFGVSAHDAIRPACEQSLAAKIVIGSLGTFPISAAAQRPVDQRLAYFDV